MSLTTIILIAVLGIVVMLTTVLFFLNRRGAEKYQIDMAFLESCLDNWIVSRRNYYELSTQFEEVIRNNRDVERTFKAWSKFHEKYYDQFMQASKEALTVINEN